MELFTHHQCTGRGLPGSGFVQRFSRMANGVVLHTNNGVHIGLALDQPPVEERGGQGSILNAAAMLDAAAKLRALPSLTASFTRQPRSGKHRTEMEEDAEVEALSLASLAVEQPALFRAVTNAEEAAKADQALRDAGENYRLTIAHEIVPTPISESSESASYLTPIQLRTAASRLRAEVAVPPFSPCTEVLRGTNLPGARARALHCDDPRFRSPWASSVDGGVGGLHDLFASCDPLFHPGMGDDRASSASSVSSFNGAEPYPLPGSVGPAPPPRGCGLRTRLPRWPGLPAHVAFHDRCCLGMCGVETRASRGADPAHGGSRADMACVARGREGPARRIP
jgi:hypothetical protein